MELLTVDKDYKLQMNPLVMGISCIKNLLKTDKSEGQHLTIRRLTYVSFMYLPYLDYCLNIPDIDERHETVMKNLGEEGKTFVSTATKKVIEWFKEIVASDISVVMYNGAAKAAKTVTDRLNNPEELLELKDKSLRPIYTLNDVLKIINTVPDTMNKLHDAKKKLIALQSPERTQYGSKEKNLMEDGIEPENF